MKNGLEQGLREMAGIKSNDNQATAPDETAALLERLTKNFSDSYLDHAKGLMMVAVHAPKYTPEQILDANLRAMTRVLMSTIGTLPDHRARLALEDIQTMTDHIVKTKVQGGNA